MNEIKDLIITLNIKHQNLCRYLWFLTLVQKVEDTVEEIKKDEIAETVEVVEKENQEEAK